MPLLQSVIWGPAVGGVPGGRWRPYSVPSLRIRRGAQEKIGTRAWGSEEVVRGAESTEPVGKGTKTKGRQEPRQHG